MANFQEDSQQLADTDSTADSTESAIDSAFDDVFEEDESICTRLELKKPL